MATNFQPVSDAEFGRLSIEEKFRHVHLGMAELAQALVELAAATAASREQGRHECEQLAERMAKNDLCVACMALVGGDRSVAPHSQLREVERSTDQELFQCASCDAWWNIRQLGWGRLQAGA